MLDLSSKRGAAKTWEIMAIPARAVLVSKNILERKMKRKI